jgi:hypothetical protein
MTTRSAADVDVALRLLDFEGENSAGAADRAGAAVRVYEKLAARLEPLIGVAGMRAVLARSAKLTKSEFPCFGTLGAVEPSHDPTSSGEQLRKCFSELDPAMTSPAAAALYGTLIGLLTSFIGERLVAQVLRSAFPAIEREPKETD